MTNKANALATLAAAAATALLANTAYAGGHGDNNNGGQWHAGCGCNTNTPEYTQYNNRQQQEQQQRQQQQQLQLQQQQAIANAKAAADAKAAAAANGTGTATTGPVTNTNTPTASGGDASNNIKFDSRSFFVPVPNVPTAVAILPNAPFSGIQECAKGKIKIDSTTQFGIAFGFLGIGGGFNIGDTPEQTAEVTFYDQTCMENHLQREANRDLSSVLTATARTGPCNVKVNTSSAAIAAYARQDRMALALAYMGQGKPCGSPPRPQSDHKRDDHKRDVRNDKTPGQCHITNNYYGPATVHQSCPKGPGG